jgi:hypothetical protein
MRGSLERVAKEAGVSLADAPLRARAVRAGEEREAPAPLPRANGNGTAATK